MDQKTILFSLGFLLLNLSLVISAPAVDVDTVSVNSEEEHEDAYHKFNQFIYEEVLDLANLTVTRTKSLYNDILQEIKNKNDTYKKFNATQIKAFLEHANNPYNIELTELQNQMIDIFDKYVEEIEAGDDEQSALLSELLENNGLRVFQKEYEAKFMEFMNKLNERFIEYKTNAVTQGDPLDKKILDAYEAMKNEKVLEGKSEKFVKFYETLNEY